MLTEAAPSKSAPTTDTDDSAAASTVIASTPVPVTITWDQDGDSEDPLAAQLIPVLEQDRPALKAVLRSAGVTASEALSHFRSSVRGLVLHSDTTASAVKLQQTNRATGVRKCVKLRVTSNVERDSLVRILWVKCSVKGCKEEKEQGLLYFAGRDFSALEASSLPVQEPAVPVFLDSDTGSVSTAANTRIAVNRCTLRVSAQGYGEVWLRYARPPTHQTADSVIVQGMLLVYVTPWIDPAASGSAVTAPPLTDSIAQPDGAQPPCSVISLRACPPTAPVAFSPSAIRLGPVILKAMTQQDSSKGSVSVLATSASLSCELSIVHVGSSSSSPGNCALHCQIILPVD